MPNRLILLQQPSKSTSKSSCECLVYIRSSHYINVLIHVHGTSKYILSVACLPHMADVPYRGKIVFPHTCVSTEQCQRATQHEPTKININVGKQILHQAAALHKSVTDFQIFQFRKFSHAPRSKISRTPWKPFGLPVSFL